MAMWNGGSQYVPWGVGTVVIVILPNHAAVEKRDTSSCPIGVIEIDPVKCMSGIVCVVRFTFGLVCSAGRKRLRRRGRDDVDVARMGGGNCYQLDTIDTYRSC
jgi:hypothetical protein